MRFTKMNGAGNDFILLDAIAEPFDESAAPALARALCDRCLLYTSDAADD